jgi:hypothetical protein
MSSEGAYRRLATHGGAVAVLSVPAGASSFATRIRASEGKDEMKHKISILPLANGRTTSMPPRLSLPSIYTKDETWDSC